MTAPSEAPRIDVEKVMRRLADQIGQQAVQIAQLEVLVAALVEENSAQRQGDAPAPTTPEGSA